jgi:hypothetical protein
LMALWFSSCDNTLGPPKDVLPERKMVSLLVELHLAEAKVKNLRVTTDSANQLYSLYELQILDTHNVSQETYLHSYQFYLDNHRLMTRVQDAVLDTLLQRQQKLERMPEPVVEETPAATTPSKSKLLLADSLSGKRERLEKPEPSQRILRKQNDNQ